MPWSPKDSLKHKKGLSADQQKKWATTANGVLKDCQAKGGKDCEGKAIRTANSKVESITVIIPGVIIPDKENDYEVVSS